MQADQKKPLPYIFKRSLVVFCLISFLIALSLFMFRNAFIIWLSDSWLPDNTSIECLDIEFGKSQFIIINSLCLHSNNLEIKISDAAYSVGNDYFSKSNFLDQASISVKNIVVRHFEDTQTNAIKESPAQPSVDLWSLPDLLPIIQIEHLKIDSFLIQQPLTIRISQPSRSELVVSGDLEANFLVGKGEVSGDVIWSGNVLIANSKLLETASEPYKTVVQDWQGLMDTPIHSYFQYTGSIINSQHAFNLENTLIYDTCGIPLMINGELNAELLLSTGQLVVDTQNLRFNIDVNKCISETFDASVAQMEPLSVAFSAPIRVSEEDVRVPSIELTSNDKKNVISMQVDQLKIDTKNNIQLQYQLSLDTPINELYTGAENINGQFNLRSHGQLSKNEKEIHLTSDINSVNITALSSEFGNIQTMESNFSFALTKPIQSDWKLKGQGDIALKNVSHGDLDIKTIHNQFKLAGKTLELTEIDVTNSIQGVNYQDYVAKNVNSQVVVRFNQNKRFSALGTSKISGISSAAFKMGSINIDHHINGNVADNSLVGNHEVTLQDGLLGNIFHDNKKMTILVPEQPVNYINPILKQFLPESSLVVGEMELTISNDNPNNSFIGNLRFNNVSLEYQDYQFINAQMETPFSVDSSGIQLNNGNIRIEEINVGIPLTQVMASLSILDSVPKIDFAQAQVIGGQIALTDFWLDKRKQLLKLDIDDVDLNKLVELQNQDGIEVTGEISGSLPISWSSGFNNIDKGTLNNDGPGKLKISNNEAFNAIKQQQKELAFLENVEFSKLSSEVTLTDDGWLDLKIGINGVNPEKNQEINFNYTHKENIFTLFKSLRITNSVQNSIEKRLNQRLSNKDNNL